jgi:hypothetical protein
VSGENPENPEGDESARNSIEYVTVEKFEAGV